MKLSMDDNCDSQSVKSVSKSESESSEESEVFCGKDDTFDIVEEFNCCYEERINRVCEELGDSGEDAAEAKLCIMQDWVRNLRDQNETLLKAVQQLECTLKKRDTVIRYYNNDICGLLETIQRTTKHIQRPIDISDIQFKTIEPVDLPSIFESILESANYPIITPQQDGQIKNARSSRDESNCKISDKQNNNDQDFSSSSSSNSEYHRELDDKIRYLKNQVKGYDKIITKNISKMQTLTKVLTKRLHQSCE